MRRPPVKKNEMPLLRIVAVLLAGILFFLISCSRPVTTPAEAPSTAPQQSETPAPSQSETAAPSPSPTSTPPPIPTHPPFPSSPVFTVITESLTLNEEGPGTHIPYGSVIFRWANGITEAYDADNNLIFIAKDSETAMLPHPSGPEGPFESPATRIIEVPNGALVDRDESDNKTMRIYLSPQKETLILTIIDKAEDYPLPPEEGPE
jgi:hypothetical protein